MGPGAPKEQKWGNRIVGVSVVGNPVCFAKSIVAGPVFGFPANFSKYPEWALDSGAAKTEIAAKKPMQQLKKTMTAAKKTNDSSNYQTNGWY